MSENQSIAAYVEAIKQKLATGEAREHTYRATLETFIEALGDFDAANDQARTAHGNPDFVFRKKSALSIVLGYAETKDITVNDLDKVAKSEQLQRYAGYNKLFLTNYLEFRFYRNGEEYERISIGKLRGLTVDFNPQEFDRLTNELRAFLESAPEPIKSGKSLALIMGQKARRIRDNVIRYFEHENEAQQLKNAELEKIYRLMRESLVHDLTREKFADMYAQTLVYGLFAARYSDPTPEDFSRKEASELVPASNPFLREFFAHIGGIHFDARLAHIVDELCEVFAVSNVQRLVEKHLRLFEVENEKDPIIHFYEDFLKAYDPAERKRMGAYYTPVPVVRFIIRQVDKILKEDFGLSQGLADTTKIVKEIDHGQELQIRNAKTGRLERTTIERREFHKVQVLDPAVGTATFLNETIKFIAKSFEGQEGRWPGYVEHDLLPRLSGFELMMAPYTIAHLKLSMTLQETGVHNLHERLGVYLTNTLEEGIPRQQDLFSIGLAAAVTEESQLASEIKHERPIMIVMGNPPYSGHSSNVTDYAQTLIKKYKENIPELKLPAQAKWLSDDYVKFIAFAEDMITKNGSGIVSMITNNGYLDNPTFRGMRWQLAKTFDKIYVLDLHGSAKKNETAPDGSKDENVFDITQGVAIILAIKTSDSAELADVYHSEVYGKRRSKFDTLNGDMLEFSKLTLDSKMFYFIPKDNRGREEYDAGVGIAELFSLARSRPAPGVVTTQDSFAISWSKEEAANKVDRLLGTKDEHEARTLFRLCTTNQWNYEKAKRELIDDNWRSNIYPIDYRPFDIRWTVYDSNVAVHRREAIMQHFAGHKNVGLVFNKRIESRRAFADIFVAENITDARRVSLKETNFITPLWLYHDDGTRTPNLALPELKRLVANLSLEPSPEQVFDYIYAALHSPSYRKKYEEFLKTGFPRVPIPANDAKFEQLADYGRQLRELHLMKSPLLQTLDTTFPEPGDCMVGQAKYDGEKVWINYKQYFGNVPEVAWSFYIGGYQPAQKWLKDRKGRQLSSDDLLHYQKIIRILTETHKIMHRIDE